MPQLSQEQIDQIKKFVETFPEEEREAKLEEILGQLVAEEKAAPQSVPANQTPQCPFCLMAEGKLKTQKVFEDGDFLAVLEINPANPGHVLLFPKRHVAELNSLGNALPDFLLLANSIATSLLMFNASVNMLFSVGPQSGQRFGHVVANIIPRQEKDEVSLTWKPKPLPEKELESLREKIVSGIALQMKKVPEKEENVDALKKLMPKPSKRSA